MGAMMSTRTTGDGEDPIIESRDDLMAVFAKGEKPPERWRIGTEHEKFVYWNADHRAPSYAEPGGIHALLIALTKFGRSTNAAPVNDDVFDHDLIHA